MTPFDPFDIPALRRLDEPTLERRRRLLVENAEPGREPVIDEMCARALPVIAAEVARLAAAKGLAREQLMSASEEAVTKLQMRLRDPRRLDLVAQLAKTLATEAVDARAPEQSEPPQLASRQPDLRSIEAPQENEPPPSAAAPQQPPRGSTKPVNAALSDALRRNEIKRNDPRNS